MERFEFPELVGDTSFERVKARILDKIGDDTHVEIKVFWHNNLNRIKKFHQEHNTVYLHMDSKYNCVATTPVFIGYVHNAIDYDSEVRSDFSSETK